MCVRFTRTASRAAGKRKQGPIGCRLAGRSRPTTRRRRQAEPLLPSFEPRRRSLLPQACCGTGCTDDRSVDRRCRPRPTNEGSTMRSNVTSRDQANRTRSFRREQRGSHHRTAARPSDGDSRVDPANFLSRRRDAGAAARYRDAQGNNAQGECSEGEAEGEDDARRRKGTTRRTVAKKATAPKRTAVTRRRTTAKAAAKSPTRRTAAAKKATTTRRRVVKPAAKRATTRRTAAKKTTTARRTATRRTTASKDAAAKPAVRRPRRPRAAAAPEAPAAEQGFESTPRKLQLRALPPARPVNSSNGSERPSRRSLILQPNVASSVSTCAGVSKRGSVPRSSRASFAASSNSSAA